jgi:hypothetical protein
METGAIVSSSKNSGAGDTGIGGNINIDVQGLINVNFGAVVKANSTGPAGDIIITGQKNITISGNCSIVQRNIRKWSPGRGIHFYYNNMHSLNRGWWYS